jgi:hypothetical protein
MRFDFDELHFPAVRFILDPDELYIELETGEKLPVSKVDVDLWHNSVYFMSEANIENQSVAITDASKEELMRWATHVIRERLGIPKSGIYGRVLSEKWIGDGPPEVRRAFKEEGCYLALGLRPVK